MGSGKYSKKTRLKQRTFGKIEAHLTQALQQVKWAEFELQELFEIESTLSFNKDVLVEGQEYDYVTRTSQNQGILQTTGFVNSENINPAGNWSLGLLQMDFFYREKPWYAGQFVRKITPKIELNKKAILFFSTLLNRQKENLLSVLVRDVDRVFRSTKISLPVTQDQKIDFDFMENFVAQLEAFHLSQLKAFRLVQLEAYLLVTGLKDYTLTTAEEQALADFQNGKVAWGEYNLEKLFGKSTRGKRLKSADRIAGDLPFVTAGEAETGVSAFIGNEVEIFKANTTTIDMFGSAKYRNYDYGGDDHIAVVHTEDLNKYAAIFMTSAIHKSSYTGKFSYARNFYAKDADELNIQLPSVNQHPDYEFMETLISAVQKLVIKDVVRYADNKIAATKQVISG